MDILRLYHNWRNPNSFIFVTPSVSILKLLNEQKKHGNKYNPSCHLKKYPLSDFMNPMYNRLLHNAIQKGAQRTKDNGQRTKDKGQITNNK